MPAVPAARPALILLLQLAYSGELGAARAYVGHRASLRDRAQRAVLGRILRDELHHRHVLLAMMAALGAAPDPRRERKLNTVGKLIALSCFVGGWFIPMYGAGKLERDNIGEYERAARLAYLAGLEHLVEPLLVLAEVEWDHELVFRTYAASHWLWRIFPSWPVTAPRAAIRTSYAAFVASGSREVERIRIPWLVR